MGTINRKIFVSINVSVSIAAVMSLFTAGLTMASSLPLPPHTPQLELELQSESFGSYQIAGTYWLPDYQNGYSGSKTPAPPATPVKCSAYGYVSSCPAGQKGTELVYPYVGLSCYKGCKPICGAKVSLGSGEVCSETCEGNCVKKACKAALTIDASETCTAYCASNNTICVSKGCKPKVSYDINTEVCATTCKSNLAVCVAKACKPRVSYDSASERCLAYCKSDSSVCISKGCKTSVTVDASTEQCSLVCKSSANTCIGKSCKSGYADIASYWCTAPAVTDCAQLGYTQKRADCSEFLGCPFDVSKVKCL